MKGYHTVASNPRTSSLIVVYASSYEDLAAQLDQLQPGAGYSWYVLDKWQDQGLWFAYVSKGNSCD